MCLTKQKNRYVSYLRWRASAWAWRRARRRTQSRQSAVTPPRHPAARHAGCRCCCGWTSGRCAWPRRQQPAAQSNSLNQKCPDQTWGSHLRANVRPPAAIMLHASSCAHSITSKCVTSRPLRAPVVRPMPVMPALRRIDSGGPPARCASSIGTSGTLAARGASTICRSADHVRRRGNMEFTETLVKDGSGSHADKALWRN